MLFLSLSFSSIANSSKISLLFVPSEPPPRLPCHFRGAKVRRIFASAKSFSIFFRTASAVRSSLKSGCKGRTLSRLLQTFLHVFSIFFTKRLILSIIRLCFYCRFRNCGCQSTSKKMITVKSTDKKMPIQTEPPTNL